MGDQMTYQEFLQSKTRRFQGAGFDVHLDALPSAMFENPIGFIVRVCPEQP